MIKKGPTFFEIRVYMGESFQVRYKQVNRPDAEKITTEYLKPIFGFALKRCKNVHDAEDLSQDIVLKSFRLYCKDFRLLIYTRYYFHSQLYL